MIWISVCLASPPPISLLGFRLHDSIAVCQIKSNFAVIINSVINSF